MHELTACEQDEIDATRWSNIRVHNRHDCDNQAKTSDSFETKQ